MRDNKDKFKTVIEKNTFYFYNSKFEESYEAYVNSIKETLLVLKARIEIDGVKKEFFEELIEKKENGLRALLALTGFSNESLKRLVTFIRVINDEELDEIVFKKKWSVEKTKNKKEYIKEWSDNRIQNKIKADKHFRKGLVNIFFEGSTIPILSKVLPLFEVKKLSISKLRFEVEAMIDTLIRYKEKGSYSGKKENNPEVIIEDILKDLKLKSEKGDLDELVSNAPDSKRTMDFIIPNKKKPKVIIECSYLVTTSSGQGDKSKTEIAVNTLIGEHNPEAKFIGFVDGIGWYVRRNDLNRMVTAYEDVFTFHEEELERFKDFLRTTFNL